MPTYQVFTSPKLLDADAKRRVAQAITRTHSDVTGANNYFAQVLFTEKADEDYYLGGQRLAAAHLFVHGTVRARDIGIKRVLVEALLPEIAAAAALEKRYVWVYLADLPPELMIEFGQVLPQPGQEAAWAAGLDEADRAYMQGADLQRKA
jgi:phenylpyruvate tautomerase PptA (4-oxalocrotonate tautomerase family)